MSDLSIRKITDDQCEVSVTVCKLGNFITEGRSEKVSIPIKDCEDIRSLSANLNHLKINKPSGIVDITFQNGQKYSMCHSIWHDLADALFTFTLNADCVKLGL